jgi:hypothetical protein
VITDITLKTAGYNSRGQLWNAFLGDEMIVRHAIEPNYKACRVLVERDIHGSAMFWFNGRATLAIRDIDKAAKLTVSEGEKNGPRTKKFQPFHGMKATTIILDEYEEA